MAQATVKENIAAEVGAVWPLLSDFASIQPGPGIESVDYEGEGVGMVRTIGLPNGKVVERLDVLDEATHTFQYAIINDDCALPFSNYSARVIMTDDGKGGTDVDWTGTFDPKGVDEATAVQVASGIYAGGIARVRKALTGE